MPSLSLFRRFPRPCGWVLRLTVGVFGAVGLFACTPPLPPPPSAPPAARVEVVDGIPPVENQVVTQYLPTSKSEEPPPGWIMEVPDDRDGLHYLVGLSDYHASEQEARNDALRYAREEYAKYTGVEVAVVDEVIRSLYGRESDILDATVARKSQSRQATDAQVSRIKPKHWYSETYRTTRQGRERGLAWKYWVLVTVPVDEIDRVQAWRRDKAVQAEAGAEAALQTDLERVRETLRLSRLEMAAGNVIPAGNRLQQDWSHLYGEILRFKGGEAPWQARVTRLEQAQKELVAEIGAIRARLFIDTGRFGVQPLGGEGGNGKVGVWVWLRAETVPQPVSGLPLLLAAENGEIVSRAVTDPSGKGEFLIGEIPAGRYRVTLDAASGSLALLGKEMSQVLARLDNQVLLVKGADDLEGAARAAVRVLFDGPALKGMPVKSVTLAPVTYGETRQPSGFGRALQQVIRQQLTAIEGLVVIEPRPRDVQAVAATVERVRGLAPQAEKLPEVKEAAQLGSAAMQAAIDGAEAALEVTYLVQDGKTVRAEMKLKEAGSDRLLAAATALISRYPAGQELYPLPSREGRLAPRVPGDIRLEVTSQLGDGHTYREGDLVSFFVSTNRDAFLLLIYEDAAHQLLQALPNRYSGSGFFRKGQLLALPGPGDHFQFRTSPPFGVEYLHAFASATPFPELPGKTLANGLVLLDLPVERVVALLAAHGGKAGNHYGEAEAMITTGTKGE